MIYELNAVLVRNQAVALTEHVFNCILGSSYRRFRCKKSMKYLNCFRHSHHKSYSQRYINIIRAVIIFYTRKVFVGIAIAIEIGS